MNTVQVFDNQIISIWFCCLAMLHSQEPVEKKIQLLENALMSRILDTQSTLAAVQTGLIPFDEAVLAYGKGIEERMRSIDASKISTGSEILDNAFKDRLQKIVDTNFNNGK
jgi:hypothetical protein